MPQNMHHVATKQQRMGVAFWPLLQSLILQKKAWLVFIVLCISLCSIPLWQKIYHCVFTYFHSHMIHLETLSTAVEKFFFVFAWFTDKFGVPTECRATIPNPLLVEPYSFQTSSYLPNLNRVIIKFNTKFKELISLNIKFKIIPVYRCHWGEGVLLDFFSVG